MPLENCTNWQSPVLKVLIFYFCLLLTIKWNANGNVDDWYCNNYNCNHMNSSAANL